MYSRTLYQFVVSTININSYLVEINTVRYLSLIFNRLIVQSEINIFIIVAYHNICLLFYVNHGVLFLKS